MQVRAHLMPDLGQHLGLDAEQDDVGVAGVVAALSGGVWFDFFLTQPYERFSITRRTDIETTVEEAGTLTWNVTFQDARYHFQCDAHPTTMKGTLTVSS